MSEKFIAVITAGGSGKRLPSKIKKQFIEILDRPMLFWSIDPFYRNDRISEIIIVLPAIELEKYKKIIFKEFSKKKISIIPGGNERQNSVFSALKICPKSTDFVLIHDGVRPFVLQDDLNRLMDDVLEKKAVIPVSPVVNTIKKIKDGFIEKTVERKYLFNALTPQIFAYDLILECHQKAIDKDYLFTDDASILEYFNYKVYTIETDSRNFKITTKADIALAEILLRNF